MLPAMTWPEGRLTACRQRRVASAVCLLAATIAHLTIWSVLTGGPGNTQGRAAPVVMRVVLHPQAGMLAPAPVAADASLSSGGSDGQQAVTSPVTSSNVVTLGATATAPAIAQTPSGSLDTASPSRTRSGPVDRETGAAPGERQPADYSAQIVDVALSAGQTASLMPAYRSASAGVAAPVARAVDAHYYSGRELSERARVRQDITPYMRLTIPGIVTQDVILELLISEHGEIDKVLFARSSLPPEAEKPVVELFQDLRFIAGKIDGVAVRSRMKIQVTLEAPGELPIIDLSSR